MVVIIQKVVLKVLSDVCMYGFDQHIADEIVDNVEVVEGVGGIVVDDDEGIFVVENI